MKLLGPWPPLLPELMLQQSVLMLVLLLRRVGRMISGRPPQRRLRSQCRRHLHQQPMPRRRNRHNLQAQARRERAASPVPAPLPLPPAATRTLV